MIFIGGVNHGSCFLPYKKTILCRYCQSRTECQVVMTYYYLNLFFLPVFRWHKRYFVKTYCCETVYELNPELGKEIAGGEEPEISGSDLRLLKEGRPPMTYERRWAQQGDGDPQELVRCPICKRESPGDFNYCPRCGQRLQ